MSQPIRVIVAEDQAMVLGALAALLETEPDIVVCDRAANGRQALTGVGKHKPDVLVTDIEMPEMTGLTLAAEVRDRYPQTRVMILIFSSHANASPQIKREVERAVNAGAIIIPMRIEDVLPEDDLEYFLGTPHWLDAFTPPLEHHLEKLAATIHEVLELPAPMRTGESQEDLPETPVAPASETEPLAADPLASAEAQPALAEGPLASAVRQASSPDRASCRPLRPACRQRCRRWAA